MNNIKEPYQLNSILDIYGENNNQTIENAEQYYIYHNSIPNGIILSDKVKPVNGMHAISNTYYYVPENDYDGKKINGDDIYPFYPILSTYNTSYLTDHNYKLISAKDIDFENAYLKYAVPSYDYDAPITYYDLSMNEDGEIVETLCNTGTTYSFGRGISSHINYSYDLLNVVDYLLNRINCLNFLIEIIHDQKMFAK